MDAQALRELAASRFEGFVADLERMVDVDCGSYTPEGVNEIADLCEGRMRARGWSVDRRAHVPAGDEPPLGDLVIGTLEGGGGPDVLMVGHMDTVFDEGTVAERPFRIEGDIARGPGVSDMKGGLLAGFHAVNASMFDLARGYATEGMTAYVKLQEHEFALESDGYTAVKHQHEVGTGWFDLVSQTISQGHSSTLALEGSTEADQF